MKRTPKKLTLSRETLGTMDERHLQQVAGALTKVVCTDTVGSGCCTATVCSDCC